MKAVSGQPAFQRQTVALAINQERNKQTLNLQGYRHTSRCPLACSVSIKGIIRCVSELEVSINPILYSKRNIETEN